jgi:hypothetical protein
LVGFPAGDVTPVSPVLDPSPEGVIAGSETAGGGALGSAADCAQTAVELNATTARVAAAAFQVFIGMLLSVDPTLSQSPLRLLPARLEAPQSIEISNARQGSLAFHLVEPAAASHVERAKRWRIPNENRLRVFVE